MFDGTLYTWNISQSFGFHCDMFLDIPYVADLPFLDKCQALIDYNLCHENYRHWNHDYQIGDQVLELLPEPNKSGH